MNAPDVPVHLLTRWHGVVRRGLQYNMQVLGGHGYSQGISAILLSATYKSPRGDGYCGEKKCGSAEAQTAAVAL